MFIPILIMPPQSPANFTRLPFSQLESELIRVMTKNDFPGNTAKTCASIFVGNSLDGVYSHGVNRFAKFIGVVKEGLIKAGHQAVLKNAVGSMEQWDGQLGPGPLNAVLCTDRAMAIATEHGIGCVALANTNHWMRGGTYGWRAAKNGFVLIAWSNTIANMPAWGAVNSKLGNNPLVIAVPYKDEAIVVDMAMSQYSYGALEVAHMKNETLSVPGGYDTNGVLTHIPQEIKTSQRALPIGYWKGAGLSLLLDILATILSGGLSVAGITKQNTEANVSQMFIAIDITRLQNFKSIAFAIDQIIADYRLSIPEVGKSIRYPGENILKVREENTKSGIPISESVWAEIQGL